MSRLQTVTDPGAGNPLPDEFTAGTAAAVTYEFTAGADVASAATIDITSRFHKLTGTTSISNIIDLEGAVSGQMVELWVHDGPVTFKNNDSGTGDIRTLSGGDITYSQNAIARFVYDGALWRETTQGLTTGAQLDYAQITAPPAAVSTTTEGTAVAIITGASVAYDGSKVKIDVFIPDMHTSSGSPDGVYVVYRDSTVVGRGECRSGLGHSGVFEFAIFDTPAAGPHTYSVKLFAAGGSSAITVDAGTGGSGNNFPAYMRVTKA